MAPPVRLEVPPDVAAPVVVGCSGGADSLASCSAFGQICGGEPLELGRLANEHPPRLRTHDRFGDRLDEVEFHPAWHRLLALGLDHGLHSLPWTTTEPGSQVVPVAVVTDTVVTTDIELAPPK